LAKISDESALLIRLALSYWPT